MALVRVYCGLASADLATSTPGSEMWLTVAVVDDAGRLLDLCDISDDALGYAELGAMLAERSSGPIGVAVAADNDDHVVTQLLVAAGRYLAYTDGNSADDFAERFADDDSTEEIQSSAAVRRAVGLARALQAGVLSAVAQATPRDLIGLKPVLSAHAAVIGGRQSAASTLREVLRELYPAALRAYPDPASAVPLAVIDALPEPSQLGSGANGRSREAAVVSALADAGVANQALIAEAVTALRVAIAETPRRTGTNKSITGAIAETIRQAVAAVRACDSAASALVSVLAERMGTIGVPAPQPSQPRPASAAASGSLPTRGRPTPPPLRAVQSPGAESTTRQRGPSQPAPAPAAAPAAWVEPRQPGVTPIPTRRPTSSPVQPPYRGGTPGDLDRYTSSMPSYANSSSPTPSPDVTPPGSRADWPLRGDPADDAPARPVNSPSAYAGDPLGDRERPGRVTPPWQADGLPAEPPALRLVEPAVFAEPGRSDSRGYAERGDRGSFDPPALRLVEPDRHGRGGPTALDRPIPPVSADDDHDLLIFAATRSGWFTRLDGEDDLDWSPNQFDQGWQAAEQLAEPAVGAETTSGLPRRVPTQNLVPGSASEPVAPERPLRIVRDAAAIAANTSGYFRGWQRGQEVGGYAVGGRPGRESAGGWDFSRDPDPDQDYEYRSASNR